MKRVANAPDPPVVIPVIVVAIDVHVALVVVPPVEGGHIVPGVIQTTVHRILSGLYRIWHLNALTLRTKYLYFLNIQQPRFCKPWPAKF